MKALMLLVVVVCFTGCAAWNSLVWHPLQKVHEMHENHEESERAYQTNHFQP